MPNPTIRIHNAETNETVDRAMTKAEFDKYQQDIEENAAKAAKVAADESAKEAVLNRLGITAEEAALLLA
jgi:hypothetical protein